MSTSIDQAFVKQYEAEVHTAYQRQGSKLRSMVRTKTITNAKDTTFQKVGVGTATTKARHGLVPVMNQAHTNVTVTLVDLYAGDWVDRLDELKTNIDERQIVAQGGAYALGRATDQQIITALDSAATLSTTLATSSKAAFKNAILESIQKLNAGDVPDDGDRWAAVSARTWSWLMLIDEFVNADYVTMDDLPFKKGFMQIRSWAGVNWFVHSGMSLSTNTRTNQLWHRTAIGHGVGQEVTADITWHGDRAAHFINHSMSMGAVLIDGNGVVEMPIDESAALATS